MKVLFTTLPSNDLGLLARSLPIAHGLAERGHTVAFCNPAPAPRRLIAEAGFDNLMPRHPLYYAGAEKADFGSLYRIVKAWRQDGGSFADFWRKLVAAVPTRLAPGTSQVWNLDHFYAILGMMNERFVRANCEPLMALMRDFGADAVVDCWNPFACIAARAVGKPVVSVIQADMHPSSRGFIWWKDAPPDLPSPVPTVNRVLAGYGLPPITKTEQLHVGDLTLVVGIPESDPLPKTAGVTYIGPILWEKPGAKLPDWFKDLSEEKPVIWVYSGNPRYVPFAAFWGDSAVVLHACIAALRDEDVQVVLTTGHHDLPKEALPLPPHFRHVPYVSGLAMARRSNLLIHHGGYGSCQTGLAAGTPAVILPTLSERESNARRVAALGAGECVSVEGTWQKHVRVDELRAKVRHVLADPSYTANAERIAQQMQTYGGAAEAARLIESFAR